MRIRVLIVDDHRLLRVGVRSWLKADPEIEVVGEAENGKEALLRIEELSPQVVLMDLLMPEMNGLDAIALSRVRFPNVEIIALTSVLDDHQILRVLKQGARGYLLKGTTSPTELCSTIKAVAEGQTTLSPEVSRRLMRSLQSPDPLEALTDRELEVLKALAQGASNKEIASSLSVSEKTVKAHLSALLLKLRLKSRTGAAVYAWQRGLASRGQAFIAYPGDHAEANET